MHSATDRAIAANAADLANHKQVPLKVLAESSGIAFDRLRGYLAADRGTLTLAEIDRLADALGVAPAALAATPGQLTPYPYTQPHTGDVA